MGRVADRFGGSVAISGSIHNNVGAYLDDDKGSNSGSAYIFDVVTGNKNKKITASVSAEGDHFGMMVAASGNYIVVGATYDDDKGSNSGSAFIYGPSSALLKITNDSPNMLVNGTITSDAIVSKTSP